MAIKIIKIITFIKINNLDRDPPNIHTGKKNIDIEDNKPNKEIGSLTDMAAEDGMETMGTTDTVDIMGITGIMDIMDTTKIKDIQY